MSSPEIAPDDAAAPVDLPDPRPPSPARRPRRTTIAATGLVLLLAAAGATVVWAAHRDARDAGGAAPAADQVVSGHAKDFVLHNGDTARGIGEVVAVPGRPVRFCAPVIEGAVGSTARVPDPCIGIDLTGVDLGRLARRRVTRGVITGEAELTGTYSQGTLRVTDQAATLPALPSLFHDHVPCAAPTGGWSGRQPPIGAATRYARAHPGAIVQLAYLNPATHESLVYVLTSGDPAPVTTALRAAYGSDLCVARSDYSTEQIAAARRATRAFMGGGLTQLYMGGGVGINHDTGQPLVDGATPILTDRVARAIDAQPAGLVHLDVWLTPVH